MSRRFESQLHCIARPRGSEKDILAGNDTYDLVVKDQDGKQVAKIPSPPKGWTYDTLEVACAENGFWCADGYLGDQWIGSTEI
ncbi:hypothetical protein [Enterovibrio norvegicus]|uniref:hypothetical protein n=1 Tax=Enterovibrio norvegicus TaxID=188144 RepID=UPI00352BD4B6